MRFPFIHESIRQHRVHTHTSYYETATATARITLALVDHVCVCSWASSHHHRITICGGFSLYAPHWANTKIGIEWKLIDPHDFHACGEHHLPIYIYVFLPICLQSLIVVRNWSTYLWEALKYAHFAMDANTQILESFICIWKIGGRIFV